MSWSAQKPFEGNPEAWAKWLREVYTRTKFGSFTWNPPNVPAASTVDTVLTTTDSMDIQGLRVGQSVSITPPSSIDAGLGWCAFVATDDTLTVRLVNATVGAINPTSAAWTFHGMVI